MVMVHAHSPRSARARAANRASTSLSLPPDVDAGRLLLLFALPEGSVPPGPKENAPWKLNGRADTSGAPAGKSPDGWLDGSDRERSVFAGSEARAAAMRGPMGSSDSG